jgi:hypothetical protein
MVICLQIPTTFWIGGRTPLRVCDVRQVEIDTPEPNHFEVEIAIAKLKKYKSPGSDQIRAELIQAGGEILPINSLILFAVRKNYLINGSSVIVPIYKGD